MMVTDPAAAEAQIVDSAGRSVQRTLTVDPETGTFTRTVSVTREDGTTGTREVTVNRTEDGFERSSTTDNGRGVVRDASIVFDTSVRQEFSADLTGLRPADNVFDDGGRQQKIDRLLVNGTGTGPTVTVYAVNDRLATYRTMRPSEAFTSGAETEIITPNTDGAYVTEVGERLVVKVAAATLTGGLIHINGASYRVNA